MTTPKNEIAPLIDIIGKCLTNTGSVH